MRGFLLGTARNMVASRVRKRRLPSIEAGTVKQPKNEEETTSVLGEFKQIAQEQPSPIAFEGDKARVLLAPGQLLVFDGHALVCLLAGRCSMLGYSLVQGEQALVASDSSLCSAVTFEPLPDSNARSCTLEFQSYEQQATQERTYRLEVEQACGVNVQPEAGVSDRKRKLVANSATRRMRPTIVPSSWWMTIEAILHHGGPFPPIVLIAGAKGMGKSTVSRLLTNRLLSRHKSVAYLDLDVGQPELTIPGCLSLHLLQEPLIGSPVLHLRDPKRCFFYGDVTAKSDPELYLKYVVDLYDYYRHHHYNDMHALPLVINTPGWVKGIGYDILVDVVRYVAPTHLLEVGDSDALFSHIAGRASTICLDSLPSRDGVSVNAVRLRELRILSYFRRAPCIRSAYNAKAFAEAASELVSRSPYEVSAEQLDVVHLHIKVPASQVLYSLNAQLVGLAVRSRGEQQQEHKQPCIGFGLIRGVDAVKRVLYVLTPCSLDKLQQVDTILHGRVEMPASLLKATGFVCPYLCRQKLVEGAGTSILRRAKERDRHCRKFVTRFRFQKFNQPLI